MKKGILTLLALNTALLVPKTSFAQSTEQLLGAIFGGVGGAAVCSQFGRGDGRVALTAACAIGGAILGSEIGRQLSRQDQDAYRHGMSQAMSSPVGRRVDWRGDRHSGHCEVVRTGHYRQQTTIQCREVRSVITNGFGQVIATQVETSCFQQNSWVRVEEREVVYVADRRDDRRDDYQDEEYHEDDRRDYRDDDYDGGYQPREEYRPRRGGRGDQYREDHNMPGYDQNPRPQGRTNMPNDYLRIYIQNLRQHYADAARLNVIFELRGYLRANRMTINDRQLDRVLQTLETRSARREAQQILRDSVR